MDELVKAIFKDNHTMRTATVRVSKVNVVTKDNEELGVKEGDTYIVEKHQLIRILEAWSKVKGFKYYLIEHNEDPNNIHYHITLDFDAQVTFGVLKKMFPYGYIDRCRYGVKSCVQYMVHLNDLDKYQYNFDDICTNAPAKLQEYKALKATTKDVMLRNLIEDIVSGKLTERDIDKIAPELYVKNRNRINTAFEYVNIIKSKTPSKQVTVYVFQGPTGAGKSTLCKLLAKSSNKSIRFSSSSNDPLCDYKNEDIFVYDDFNSTKTKIEDFIKALDPHVNTSTASRYHNKLFTGDTIILCTNRDILDWYIEEDKEVREALFRRIFRVLCFEKLAEDKVVRYYVKTIDDLYEDRRQPRGSGENLDQFEYQYQQYHDNKYKLKEVDLKKYIDFPAFKTMQEKSLEDLDKL